MNPHQPHPNTYPVFGGLIGQPDNVPALALPYVNSTTETKKAVAALTPHLFQTLCELVALKGATEAAALANLLGFVSFAAAGNFQVRGHNGKTLPLSLNITFLGGPLNGKSEAHDRFKRPIVAAMRGWERTWAFGDTTPSALMKPIRQGMNWGQLRRDEGRTFFKSAISRSFDTLSNLYEGEPPEFSRVDDIAEGRVNKTPESIAFSILVNTQALYFHQWREKYRDEALGSGYLYRVLIIESKGSSEAGAGGQQPESALLLYDKRITELIEQGRRNMEMLDPNQLPVLEVSVEATQVLQDATAGFINRASGYMRPDEAKVLAIRLSSNTRRIAGCMHVYEEYSGPVTADTMTRACVIANFILHCWLEAVFPPQLPSPVPQAKLDADTLENELRNQGVHSMRQSDLVATAPNLGWTKTRMKEAIRVLCGSRRATINFRTINGRRNILLELPFSPPLPLRHI